MFTSSRLQCLRFCEHFSAKLNITFVLGLPQEMNAIISKTNLSE